MSNRATSHIAQQRKQLIEDATSFLRLMASDVQCQKTGIDWNDRLSKIITHITETGTYFHTESELEFGARWLGATATGALVGTCGAPCA